MAALIPCCGGKDGATDGGQVRDADGFAPGGDDGESLADAADSGTDAAVADRDAGGADPGPDAELCNGLDDDGDGQTDEDFPGLGAACDGPDSDACPNGVLVCSADGSGTVCGDEEPAGIQEICNGLDDDCDGSLPAEEQDTDGDGVADCMDPVLGYDCAEGLQGRPLGGGEGYGAWVDPAGPRTTVVATRVELLAALEDARPGDTVYVDDGAVIDLGSEREVSIEIREGVTLASGRGRDGSLGALLYTDEHDLFTYGARSLFVITGERVRVTGLRLRGPDTEVGETAASPMGIGIRTYFPEPIGPREVEVDNCVFWGWSDAAVSVYRTDRAYVHHNDFHHNRRAGFGYGVVVNLAYPTIGANVFDHNRHAIAATGYPQTSYEACHNLVLPHATSTSFDMHGGFDKGFYPDTAGSSVFIHHNTFLAGQVDGIGIRGVPDTDARFEYNRFVHAPDHTAYPSAMWQRFWPEAPGCLSTGGCVTAPWEGHPGYLWMEDKDVCRAACSPSVKRRDPATFEGIGCAHNTYGIAHQTAWFASFGGAWYWSFRRFAGVPAPAVLFGDFDGDGTQDGFRANGGSWTIYPSLRGEGRVINSSSVPQGDLGLGDFDGDGIADVFYADGSSWQVSWGGTSSWEHLNTSGIRREGLVLADFDGDGEDDVFRANGTSWVVSWSGASAWQTLRTDGTPLSGLAFGDFDGDGNCDVFHADGSRWLVSWSGATSFEPINTSGITRVAVADLDGDGRADVFRANGATWSVSWSGSTGWQVLQDAPEPMDDLAFADVNGDECADVLALR